MRYFCSGSNKAGMDYAVITAHAKGKAEGKIEGKAEGKIEGKAEGKIEGKAEGIAEGVAKANLELAKKLLSNGMDITQVSNLTGISQVELYNLA